MKSRVALLLFLVFCLCSVVCFASVEQSSAPVSLRTVGSTIPSSLVQYWNSLFYDSTMKVVNTYYGVQQTGAAKALFTSNSVDFVVVDIPYTLKEKTQMELQRRSQIAHYPLAATGVVFSWNRSAGQNNNTAVLPSSLNLSPEIIAKIYKGSITMWDDDLILELNPGVAFPVDFPITPVVLAGQAGSTFLLNKYLSISYPSYSPSGNSLYDLPLPNSIQAKTPQEVADALATLPGAFAYLPFSDMLSRHLPSARLCTAPNDLASCVAPSVSSFASAMDSASIVSSNTDKVWPSDLLLAQQPIQPSNPMPYPLTFFVYAIFTTDQSSAGASGAALGAYMQWVITNQPQQHAANYGFARLNQATIQINNATVYSDSVSAAMTYASGTSPSQYWPYVSPSSPQPQNPVPSNSPVTPPQQSYAIQIVIIVILVILLIVLVGLDNYRGGCIIKCASTGRGVWA